MAMFGLLKAELSKYRKRKTISMNGSIAGVHAPAGSSQQPQFPIDLPHQTPVYDPTHAAYDLSGPEYVLPQAWFEGISGKTMDQIRLDAIELERPQREEVRYDDNLITPELLDMALAEIAGRFAPETIDKTVADPSAIEEISAVAEASELSSPQQTELADVSQGALSEMPMQENIQTLDQIVEQEFSQLEAAMQQAFEQPMEDPYEQQMLLYEQQMQQMLNPFLMQGGFGPPMP
jgi:hypothetical protein